MTSTFVSKAALIAKCKLENSRVEKKEKKKIPDKEECKRVPDKPNEDKLKEEQKKVREFSEFSWIFFNFLVA